MLNTSPPHSIESEQQLIGTVIYEGSNLEKVKGRLYPDDFYHGSHQKIWQGILDLEERSEVINLLTVNEILRQQGQLDKVGGPGYLSELTDNLITSSNLESALKLIKKASQKRWLLNTARKFEQACLNGADPSELVSDLQLKLNLIKQEICSTTDSSEQTLDDIILAVGEFCTLELPAKDTLLFPWLKEQSINLISGWRGTGKTWFALGLLDAISKGKPFGPWECKKSVPTLFLDGEMPAQDTQERLKNLRVNADFKNPVHIYSDAYANQYGFPKAHLANESWRSKMKQILLTHHIKLWFVDNLASLASGLDENKKQDWDPINQWLLELRFAGISTIMLHHVNKDGGQRGTSAREDNLDISIILKTPHDYTPEDGARFIVHFSKARVSTKDAQAIGDYEFKLREDDSGLYVCTWGSVKGENRKEVLRLLNDGIDNKTITKNLSITKGYVSQIRKQAIKDGLLTAKGQLTQSGFLFVSED